MNEEVLFCDDERTPRAVYTSDGKVESPAVVVRRGKLTVGNDYHSLHGVVKSTVQVEPRRFSPLSYWMRVGSATVFWFFIVLKLFVVIRRGLHAPEITYREIFDGWYVYLLFYVAMRWYKFKDDAKRYHEASVMLIWPSRTMRVVVGDYLPRENRYEELYGRLHRYSCARIEKDKEERESRYNENVRRVEAISKAIGEALL